MNDNRTEGEKHIAWMHAVKMAKKFGWKCLAKVRHASSGYVNKWIFQSPSGTIHDLSAADMSKLEYIEARGLMIVT